MATKNTAEVDPRKKTEEYLERHKIPLLLESVLAQLLFFKPQDPKAFIVQYLEKLKRGQADPLVSGVDLTTVFSMFDITKRGCITTEQANNAFKTIVGPTGNLSTVGVYVSATKLLNESEFVDCMTKALQQAVPTRIVA